MKGIYVINSLEGGGAEHIFSLLIKLLSEDKSFEHSIEIILLDRNEEKHPLPNGIKVHRLNCGTNKLSLLWQYLGIIKKVKPDYVFSFLTRANSLNVAGSIIFSYQSIISERSNTSERLGSNFFGQIKQGIVRLIYNKASCIVAVSKDIKRCLENDYNISSDKIVILNNPIDIDKINRDSKLEINERSSPIVAMGRLTPIKGFDILIRAYASSGLDCGIQILGQGSELHRLQHLADELGIGHQVKFLGFKENPLGYLKNALFFVLSSKSEGFPNALLEAMALGKAVIATDCGGSREILGIDGSIPQGKYIHAKQGLIIQVNDIQALSSAMVLVANDEKIRVTLEAQSLLRAQDFNVEHFYTRFQNILKKIKDKS